MHFSGGIRGDLRRLHSLALPDRFEDFSRGFQGLTGSAGVVWSPLPALNLRANVARGFRAPNLSELASNGVHEGTVRYERGNSDLKPEFSLQGDLGADFTSEHLSLTAAVFCNRIDNYIYAARTGEVEDGYQVYRYEADGAFLYGTELSVDCHPVHRLHLGADWSYVRGTSDGRDLPLMPAPRLAAEVKWEITHDGKVLNNSYIAFRADHRFAQEHFLPGTETATEAYTLLGASAVTDLMVRGRRAATLSIIADNLTDAVYFDHLSRLKYVGVHNPGRNLTVKLEIPIL